MWEFQGVNDPTRLSEEEPSKKEVETRVRSLTTLKASDSCDLDQPVAPLDATNKLPEVSC